MFKKKPKKQIPYNPWIAAKREWMERNGAELAALRWWRLIGLFALMVAAVAIAGAMWFAAQPTIKPFVVAVDDLGRAQAIGVMEKAGTADERVIRSQLGRFIENWRLVSADGARQRVAIDYVYAMLPAKSAARTKLNDWYSKNNPLTRAKNQLVDVQLSSVLKVTERTYQIEWHENIYEHTGVLLSKTRYKAAAQIKLQSPTDEQQVYLNPLGVLLENLSFTSQN